MIEDLWMSNSPGINVVGMSINFKGQGMKLRIFSLLLLLICPLIYAQTLSIGITGDNPPFNARIDQRNHFYGFDVELMDEICKRMGVHCNYIAMSLSELFVAVESNRIDVAVDSIIITSNRSEYFLFSNPYLTSRVRFMVRTDSVYKSPDDLKGKNIGLRMHNPYNEFLAKFFKNDIHVQTFVTTPDVIEALSDGKIDAMLVNNISADYWAANNANQFRLLGEPMPFGNGFGIMANKGQAALILKLNAAMQQMEADGFYKNIYSHYFSW